MSQVVVDGASCVCSFGTGPGQFFAKAQAKVRIEGKAVGTGQDAMSTNFTPFNMCTSLANPQVAAATAAALGVLTPQPCMVTPAGMWTGVNAARTFGGIPCLTAECQLFCGNGAGTIQFTSPGQMKVSI